MMQRPTKKNDLPILKDTVNINELYPACDFLIAGLNQLICSESSDFQTDHYHLYHRFKAKGITPPLVISLDSYYNDVLSYDPWARDFISSKTNAMIYTLNDQICSETLEPYSDDIIFANNNIGNVEVIAQQADNFKIFDDKRIKHQISGVFVSGGNVFNCVNAFGKPYTIIGETGLISRQKIDSQIYQDLKLRTQPINAPIISPSATKYPNDLLFSIKSERNEIISNREINKNIVKSQIEPKSKLIVIPNAWAIHIDLEMAILPNGVALIHSFDESFKLMKKHKRDIKKHCDYHKLYKNMTELTEICQPLYTKAKEKLTKHGFIVKEVCGYLTTTKGFDGLIAMGFNGLPIVCNDGTMTYTVPPNPSWFNQAFVSALNECKVKIYCIGDQNVDFIKKNFGFFRCQTNTIPLAALQTESQITSKRTNFK